MSISQSISKVKNREERTAYKGKFNSFAAFGNSLNGKRYSMSYEKDPYSKHQNNLYKRAMFGIGMFTQEEIKAMHPEKVERIKKVHKKTQKELNIWKQEKIIALTNKIFGIFSKKEGLCKDLIELYSKPDPKFISRTSFKDLSISKEDIILRLVDRGLLPKNFMHGA